MKKIIGLSMLTLLLSVTTLTAQTDCDPDTQETIAGRCARFSSPDGDIAVCNDVPKTGTICGYGTILRWFINDREDV